MGKQKQRRPRGLTFKTAVRELHRRAGGEREGHLYSLEEAARYVAGGYTDGHTKAEKYLRDNHQKAFAAWLKLQN